MGRRNKRQSNSSYKFAQIQNVVLDDYGVSFIIITDTWLVSLDCLNTLIMMKSETDNVVPIPQILGQEHLHAIIKQVEEMLRTTCHTVIKALMKFMHISHDGHIYQFVRNFQTSFRALLSNIWL